MSLCSLLLPSASSLLHVFQFLRLQQRSSSSLIASCPGLCLSKVLRLEQKNQVFPEELSTRSHYIHCKQASDTFTPCYPSGF